MLAVPYSRYSSAGQGGGTSVARQTANPEAYSRPARRRHRNPQGMTLCKNRPLRNLMP
jgi:hypothetical protein